MNRSLKTLIAALVIAAPAAAFADHKLQPLGDEQFKHVEQGETQDQVASQIGAPQAKQQVGDETHWYYEFEDAWGERSTLDVAFDATGQVAHVGEIRELD